MATRSWLPLESNPDVLTAYAKALGACEAAAYSDVLGTDDELLAMVPQPVHAVLLLFPISAASEAAKAAQEEALEPSQGGGGSDAQPMFLTQTVGNACGTIGLIHAALNCAAALPPAPGSFLARFGAACEGKSPAERAHLLASDAALDAAHGAAAALGQSAQPAEVDLHFVCFVQKGGHLWELDGRKPWPVRHGPSGAGALLRDAAALARTAFMDVDPAALNFSLVALCAAE